MLTIAIIGRPNVGKSTLFNRLVGKRLALVDNQPGVTRDLREGAGKLGDLRFRVVDTAGLEEAADASLEGRMRRLTEQAIKMADLCLFLVDARTGITSLDEILARLLRKRGAEVVLVANKAEGTAGEAGAIDAFRLGLGEPLSISAEHGEGMAELYAAIQPHASTYLDVGSSSRQNGAAGDPATPVVGAGEQTAPSGRPLQIAVLGRPNAGKSTLINRILGEERLLTGPEAGITRDAVSVSVDWGGAAVRLFDTAGMRRRAKVHEKLEKLSVADGLRAVRFAEVVIVLLDAQIPFESQDLRIIDLVEREGRAVVVAVNKWDLVAERAARLAELRETFERLLPQLKGAELVAVSAETGEGLERLQQAVLSASSVWNRRVTTAQLNRWLAAMVAAHPPPAPAGRRIKLRYATQAKTRPPGFVIMCSQPDKVPDAYRRYLINGLREDFDMPGTPIRLALRSQADKNPYRGRKKAAPSKLRKHLRKDPPGRS